MAQSKSIRINFTADEQSDIELLMQEMNASTVHGLIRKVIAYVAEEKREAARRYGGGGSKDSRETNTDKPSAAASRLKRAEDLRLLSDEELTDKLRTLGILSPDVNRENGSRSVFRIATNEFGERWEVCDEYRYTGELSVTNQTRQLEALLAKIIREKII